MPIHLFACNLHSFNVPFSDEPPIAIDTKAHSDFTS